MRDDISQHKPGLDDVVVLGNELIKHSTGDDVLMVQDQVDSSKTRYNNFTTRCGDTLAQLEQALPVAQNFYDSHGKLLDWLHHIEPELRSKELTGPEAEKQVQVSCHYMYSIYY